MGSGKTVVGGLVAERAHALFFDLDFMIENEAGMAISDIFATRSEEAFRAIESRLLPDVLKPGAVAALGGGTPVPESNWKLIQERSITVYLEASFESIWSRIRGFSNRPVAAGRTREQLNALLEERRPRYEEAAHRVDADQSLDAVAAEVMNLWSD
ncbi:MAG TPA: shikimate kinase [Candidatus Dormibacteraeota bacterium]|jgi:shikimate kinase